eukprot:sb/3475963/
MSPNPGREKIKYSRTPIYRDARGKGFCLVNRGSRYIRVKYCLFPILGEDHAPRKSGFDCMEKIKYSRTPIYRDARGKGFCLVNRGSRYIRVKYCLFPILGEDHAPRKSGFDCMYEQFKQDH